MAAANGSGVPLWNLGPLPLLGPLFTRMRGRLILGKWVSGIPSSRKLRGHKKSRGCYRPRLRCCAWPSV